MSKTVTITIPKTLARKGELILVPRKEYEELLRQKKIPIVSLTSTEQRDLESARRELKRGEYTILKELENELGVTS